MTLSLNQFVTVLVGMMLGRHGLLNCGPEATRVQVLLGMQNMPTGGQALLGWGPRWANRPRALAIAIGELLRAKPNCCGLGYFYFRYCGSKSYLQQHVASYVEDLRSLQLVHVGSVLDHF